MPPTSPFPADLTALAALAKALGHPARLAILRTLAARGTCVCGEVVDVLPLAQATVSQHLKALKEAGLVIGETDGPRSCYCLAPGAIARLTRAIGSFLDDLDPDADRPGCC